MARAEGTLELPEGVWVDGPTALELASALQFASRAARTQGGELSPRLLAAARSFRSIGERWAARERQTYRDRNAGIPPESDSARVAPMRTIGSREASEILGVSPRAVTAAANRGTLPARLVGDVWTYELADVIEAAEAKKAKKERFHVA